MVFLLRILLLVVALQTCQCARDEIQWEDTKEMKTLGVKAFREFKKLFESFDTASDEIDLQFLKGVLSQPDYSQQKFLKEGPDVPRDDYEKMLLNKAWEVTKRNQKARAKSLQILQEAHISDSRNSLDLFKEGIAKLKKYIDKDIGKLKAGLTRQANQAPEVWLDETMKIPEETSNAKRSGSKTKNRKSRRRPVVRQVTQTRLRE